MRTPDFRNETAVSRRPHHVAPSLASVRVILACEQMGDPRPGGSEAGLDVIGNCTARVLRRNGVHAEVWKVRNGLDLLQRLEAESWHQCYGQRAITHVVVNNPRFVPPGEFAEMASKFVDIEFIQLNHSGLAYLGIDDWGVWNIKEIMDLETALHNVRVAANNPRFQNWMNGNFGVRCLLLPNLYDVDGFRNPVVARKDYDPLRIGSFGAGRPWKNQLIAAEAAMTMARRLGVNLELYINSGHWDADGPATAARVQLLLGVPWAKLIQIGWQAWPKFRRVVGSMDILLSPSFDETFLVVCADGIAEGVPSVVSGAVEWAPRSWQAEPWDQSSVSSVGLGLLHARVAAVHDGRQALTAYVDAGVALWLNYLTS